MNPKQLRDRTAWVVSQLERHFGEPRWPGPQDFLEDLIWTLLSQNTNDKNAASAYRQLRDRLGDWHSIMNSPVPRIADSIRSAGLSNQKAARIKEILTWVNQTWSTFDVNFLCQHDRDAVRDQFLLQKGIGIKTISVTLMSACGHDVFPVDTHVHRICTRLHLVPSSVSAEKTHDLMQPLVPKSKCYSLHINLLRLGRKICRSRKPDCGACPLQKKCPSAQAVEEN